MQALRGLALLCAVVAVQGGCSVCDEPPGPLSPPDAAAALAGRLLGANIASQFSFEHEPQPPHENTAHWEVMPAAQGENIVIRGTDAVAMASGLNHYLKYAANCSVSWSGDQLDLPDPLPRTAHLEGSSPYEVRYYFNGRTAAYSTAWWNCTRWQREIDWMALNGINMPYVSGTYEAVMSNVLSQLGLSQNDTRGFFTGPAFLPWNRMGEANSWGGPLPGDWIPTQNPLMLKVIQAMRCLGMKVILPGFSGSVPSAFADSYSSANVTRTGSWNGFLPTYSVVSDEFWFKRIMYMYITEQTRMFGTDSMYFVDVWDTLLPDTDDPEGLGALANQVYSSILPADQFGQWVLPGWMFVENPIFWQDDQIKGFLQGVPGSGITVLDMFAESAPVWNRTDSFFGHRFVWNMMHNFGGRTGLYGRLPEVASVTSSVSSPSFVGVGVTMEGINTNPVVYDRMLENIWTTTVPPSGLTDWVHRYAERRYGVAPTKANPMVAGLPKVHSAWDLLLSSVYSCPSDQRGTSFSVIASRPAFNMSFVHDVPVKLYYDAGDVVSAWSMLLKAADENSALVSQATFTSDIVALTAQAVSDKALSLYEAANAAYAARDLPNFQAAGKTFLPMLAALDAVLATQGDLLASTWIADAVALAQGAPSSSPCTGSGCTIDAADRVSCGDFSPRNCSFMGCCYNGTFGLTTAPHCYFSELSTADVYELNARSLVSLWGPSTSRLHDYAYKLWSGLVSEFYVPRWMLWFQGVEKALQEGQEFDMPAFTNSSQLAEELWVTSTTPVTPAAPEGDAIELSAQLFASYFSVPSPQLRSPAAAVSR